MGVGPMNLGGPGQKQGVHACGTPMNAASVSPLNRGLWDNIHAKRERGGKMREPGDKGAPTDKAFRDSQ